MGARRAGKNFTDRDALHRSRRARRRLRVGQERGCSLGARRSYHSLKPRYLDIILACLRCAGPAAAEWTGGGMGGSSAEEEETGDLVCAEPTSGVPYFRSAPSRLPSNFTVVWSLSCTSPRVCFTPTLRISPCALLPLFHKTPSCEHTEKTNGYHSISNRTHSGFAWAVQCGFEGMSRSRGRRTDRDRSHQRTSHALQGNVWTLPW